MRRTKNLAFVALCTTLALILAYAEALMPPVFAAVPGIKMGLPNIVLVFLLYRRGPAYALGVSLLRIVLVSLLFGNVMAMMYSLAGGILSMLVMILLRRMNCLSVVGVSVTGAVMHNLGQILIAMLLLETAQIAYYLVVLTLTGTIAGVLIGLCGAIIIQRIPPKYVDF